MRGFASPFISCRPSAECLQGVERGTEADQVRLSSGPVGVAVGVMFHRPLLIEVIRGACGLQPACAPA